MSSARLSLLPETSSVDNVEMPEEWHEEANEEKGTALSGGGHIRGRSYQSWKKESCLFACMLFIDEFLDQCKKISSAVEQYGLKS